MGNSLCAGGTPNGARQFAKKQITVYGDYTSPDTRAILAVLATCKQPYKYINLDVLSNKHETNSKFLEISPSLDYPVMTDDSFIIICSSLKSMNFLVATRDMVKKTLMPVDYMKQITTHMNWFESMMRPKTKRAVNMLLKRMQMEKESLQESQRQQPSQLTKDGSAMQQANTLQRTQSLKNFGVQIDHEIECVKKLVEALNVQLKDSLYFGGQLSIADIVYYIEISTITILSGKSVMPKNTKIEMWFMETMQREEIRELDMQLKQSIDDFKNSKKVANNN